MIHVDRTQVDPPSVLDPTEHDDPERQSDGKNERDHNVAESEKKEPDFKFKIYKDNEVRQALHKLFHGKCAYCETRYLAAQQMDVEHWRPKKEVEKWGKVPARRGYYWLGSTWENLLPSCADCNRRREHVDFAADLLAPGETVGKRAIFPVDEEDVRWTHHDNENTEEPLLINPCDDRPEVQPQRLLRISEEGVVSEAGRLSRLQKRLVKTSIKVYGLNRPGLVHERLAWIRLLQHKMAAVDQVAQFHATVAPDSREADLAEDLLQFLLADLRSFSHPDRPYALTAQQVTEGFLADYDSARQTARRRSRQARRP